jgi:hypothetical protein
MLYSQGGRSNLHRVREVEHNNNNADSPLYSTSFTSQNHLPSQNTGAESSISGQTSEYEDAESGKLFLILLSIR